jgi:hypothetical protein
MQRETPGPMTHTAHRSAGPNLRLTRRHPCHDASHPARRAGAALLASLAGLAAALVALPLHAGEPAGFDIRRWATLLREPAPAVVVFTTTDCAYCPDAIDHIARHLQAERRAGRPVPRLDVVVLDSTEQPDTLAADAHYRLADRLFVVEGQAARVRRSVNPGWFGQTPYVALIPAAPRGAAAATPRFVSGTPTSADLDGLR